MKTILILLTSFFFFSAQAVDMEQLKAELKKRAEEHQAKVNARKETKAAAAQDLPAGLVCDASLRNGICYAFTGTANTDSKVAKGNEMACKFLRGQLKQAGICPSARLLGRCKVVGGQPKEYVLHYYMGGKLNLAKAQEDCANPKSGLHAQGAGEWM
jgi:hypothetical protein